jgi:hypothetical protein
VAPHAGDIIDTGIPALSLRVPMRRNLLLTAGLALSTHAAARPGPLLAIVSGHLSTARLGAGLSDTRDVPEDGDAGQSGDPSPRKGLVS